MVNFGVSADGGIKQRGSPFKRQRMKRGPVYLFFHVHHFERRIRLFVAGCGHEAQMLCYQNAKG
jgi:hypothetical protein